jgi:hypothetical protein
MDTREDSAETGNSAKGNQGAQDGIRLVLSRDNVGRSRPLDRLPSATDGAPINQIKLKRYVVMVIVTKYLAPTNNKGARVQAKSDQGEKVIIPWEHALSSFQNHEEAVKQLVARITYKGDVIISNYENGLIAVIGGFKL